MYNRRCTPERITSLFENEVFVFGTNPEGQHNSKAALYAVSLFGAKMGCGEGFSGQSYAIPVHKHHCLKMVDAVRRFIRYAKAYPNLKFLVTAVGCGKAGMDPSFVALMFRESLDIENILLPQLFVDELRKYDEIGVEISEDCMTIVRFPMEWKGTYNVPKGIEHLGDSSFMGCFCDLVLPETLKTIGKWAFCDMGGFDYGLKIPSSVKFIDDKAFECEWCSPIMLVDYRSYAYNYAKRNKVRYKCIDFDEEKYAKEQKELLVQENKASTGLGNYLSRIRTMRPIPKGQIAIARDFAIVLNDDNHQTLIGNYESYKQLRSSEKFVKVAAAFSGYMALTKTGRIITCGKTREFDKPWEIAQLSNVCDLAACEGHVAAIFGDGHVVSIDEPGGWEGTPRHNDIVKNWQDIKQIAVGYANIMGLTKTGKVLYHSVDGFTDSHYYDDCSDVVQIDCYSHYYGTDSSAVLHSDGTVTSDTFEGVKDWKDIIQISVGADMIVGLKDNGTIEMIDERGTRNAAKKWRNIACVECKFFGIVGITHEGEILSFFAS